MTITCICYWLPQGKNTWTDWMCTYYMRSHHIPIIFLRWVNEGHKSIHRLHMILCIPVYPMLQYSPYPTGSGNTSALQKCLLSLLLPQKHSIKVKIWGNILYISHWITISLLITSYWSVSLLRWKFCLCTHIQAVHHQLSTGFRKKGM